MIVMGVVGLAAFVIWEKFFAKVKFFPFEFLKDRTFLGAVMSHFVVFMTTLLVGIFFARYFRSTLINRMLTLDIAFGMPTTPLISRLFTA